MIYLAARKQGYAREISEFYNSSLSPIQIQLDRLESGNVLVSHLSGRTRIYAFNPRYPFREELVQLLNKAISFLPEEKQENLLYNRKRPRRKSKPL
ncbi:MAG: ArsR family transcriptional regulator [candidate division KSB1 bacterium]|nr:ArsR family transcriptional regulator [candidate division KSB1 bacterium]